MSYVLGLFKMFALAVLIASQTGHMGAIGVCGVTLQSTTMPSYTAGARAIVALSPSDIYAAGPSALHWNGSRWMALSPPAPIGELLGVSAIASGDVWFAGATAVKNNFSGSPVLALWKRRRWLTKILSGVIGRFENVYAVSDDNVWAVGESAAPSVPLIAHWDGHHLKLMSAQHAPGFTTGSFTGIAGTSAKSIWISGNYGANASLGRIERLDGRRWRVAWSSRSADITSLTVISPRDAWAVGYKKLDDTSTQAFALHWNGVRWQEVTIGGAGDHTVFFGVTAISGTDVWAVGERNGSTLVAHFDGLIFSVTPQQQSMGRAGVLQAVTFDGRHLWASGYTYTDPTSLAMRWLRSDCSGRGEGGN